MSKKTLLLLLLLVSGASVFSAAGQIKKNENYVIGDGSVPALSFVFHNSAKLAADGKETIGEPIDSVAITVMSKKVTKTQDSGQENYVVFFDAFKSGKIHVTVKRKGFKTIEQDVKLDSVAESFDVFMTGE